MVATDLVPGRHRPACPTIALMDEAHRLRALIETMHRSVRPVVFETEMPDFELSARGTLSMVSFRGRGFAVTNRHVLAPETQEIPRLCIFANDGAKTILPLREATFVPRSVVDADCADLIAIELDPDSIEPTYLLSLDHLAQPTETWSTASEFFLVGFPDHRSAIDYERRHLSFERVTLRGKYDGQSELPNLHRLKIQGAQDHPSFSGWSGSPVFSYSPRGSIATDIVSFCGIAVLGSPAAGTVQFIDAGVLYWLLEAAVTPGASVNMNGRLPLKRPPLEND